jgi:hypothetical protein
MHLLTRERAAESARQEATMRTFFEGTRPGRLVTWGTAEFELPVLYFRDDSFGALFSADLDKLRAVMPSDNLHPIPLLRPGRGFIYIGAYDYLDTSVGAYGEVAVAVPAVYGRRPPPLLPTLLESRWPGLGGVILHLPVTNRMSRDGGRGQWGYTKFLADMEFQTNPEYLECRLEEDGDHILTLRVAKRGITLPDRRPLITYSVKDGDLIRTRIPQTMLTRTALGARGSSLALGETHPVAQSIKALGVDPRPLMTRYHLDRSTILPEGEVLERGVRPLDGYIGSEREEGELRIGHVPAAMLH